MSRRISFFISIFLFFNCLGFTQDRNLSIPRIQYFSSEDYQGGIQNYQIGQDHRGVIYVCNNLGLLEYDGNIWQKYATSNGTKVRSFLSDLSGRLYVGAQDEFGMFKANNKGELEFESFNALIPEKYKGYGDVWNILPYKEKLLFATFKDLFVYDGNAIEVIETSARHEFTFIMQGQIVSHFKDEGLKSYSPESGWSYIPQGSFFADKRVMSMVVLNQHAQLIATYEHGLYLYDKNSIIPWKIDINEKLKEYKINTLIRLKNGNVAIGTESEGLFILTPTGEVELFLTKDRGLNNRTVLNIYEDTNSNLWVGLNNGLARIELQTPFSFIDEQLELPGTGYTALGSSDFFYYGTNTGLFSLDKRAPESEILPIENVKGQVYKIQSIKGDILVAGHNGAYVIRGSSAIEISNEEGWWTFVGIPKTSLAIGGNYNGLFLLNKSEDGWHVLKKYENFNESARVMVMDNQFLWMSHGYKGVYRFTFSDDYNEIKEINFYNSKDGFPGNYLINVFEINNEIVFGTSEGVYKYDNTNNRFALHPEYIKIFNPGEHIRFLSEDALGNIYFIAENRSGIIRKSAWGEYSIEWNSFNKIHDFLNDDLDNISIVDNENILFGAKEGFIRYNPTTFYHSEVPFKTIFRQITNNRDSLIYGGNAADEKLFKNIELPYSDNSIHFRFSALHYDDKGTMYRWKLKGFDNEWSDWSEKTEKGFTNLNEGVYEFIIQAQNIYNTESPVHSIAFSILPPWYRSNLAYTFYLFFIMSSITGLVFLVDLKYNKQKRKLISEQEIKLMQKDNILQEVSKKSEEEINRLKNEKLMAEINHKNKELATSTMHLLYKNEFISHMKNQLNQIQKKETNVDLSKDIGRIVKDIEKNISHDEDWQHFEFHFDQVHGDFISNIKKSYPDLTPQELKLCAYLRMNMSTKEIANLMQISTRGVETGRYRIRKKLNLTRNENLLEFIMHF